MYSYSHLMELHYRSVDRGGHRNFPKRGEAGPKKKYPGPYYDFGLGRRMKSGAAESYQGQMPWMPPPWDRPCLSTDIFYN